jgi:hypothetical protein
MIIHYASITAFSFEKPASLHFCTSTSSYPPKGVAGHPAGSEVGPMPDDILPAFEDAYVGESCSVTRRENDWVFSFGDNGVLAVNARWRLIQTGRIVLADEDDRQRFGLPRPVDAKASANGLLE